MNDLPGYHVIISHIRSSYGRFPKRLFDFSSIYDLAVITTTTSLLNSQRGFLDVMSNHTKMFRDAGPTGAVEAISPPRFGQGGP